MTVAELIEKLKDVPGHYVVREGYRGHELDIHDVVVIDSDRDVYL